MNQPLMDAPGYPALTGVDFDAFRPTHLNGNPRAPGDARKRMFQRINRNLVARAQPPIPRMALPWTPAMAQQVANFVATRINLNAPIVDPDAAAAPLAVGNPPLVAKPPPVINHLPAHSVPPVTNQQAENKEESEENSVDEAAKNNQMGMHNNDNRDEEAEGSGSRARLFDDFDVIADEEQGNSGVQTVAVGAALNAMSQSDRLNHLLMEEFRHQ